MAAHGAVTDSAGETVPAVMGALQTVADALIQFAEFMVQVLFDVVLAGDVG